MKHKLLLFFLLFSYVLLKAQCNQKEVISICDITKIDNNNDGVPDGIINLYDEYKKLTNKTIQNGTWVEVSRNFALLNKNSGEVNIWNLPNSTNNKSPAYEFKLYNNSCGLNTIALTLKIQLGPFSGFVSKTTKGSDVNLRVCYTKKDQLCNNTEPKFDLRRALGPLPAAHKNGTWQYLGSSANFRELKGNFFAATIPYEPGGNLIDQDYFDFKYTVSGSSPCNPSSVTNVRISVVRGVSAGRANTLRICEGDLISGTYNNDIDLRDDQYLLEEDIEGKWLYKNDPTNQITSPTDSQINLKQLYDQLYQQTPRFKNKVYSYSYSVEDRSNFCGDDVSSINFVFVEKIRPFKQKKELPKYCIGDSGMNNISLYDLLEFTTENKVLYDYPEKRKVNYWQITPKPNDLDVFLKNNPDWKLDVENNRVVCLDPKTKVNFSYFTESQAGIYSFKYYVPTKYNILENEQIRFNNDLCEGKLDKGVCETEETATVKIIIQANTYAGENTAGLELCESQFQNPVNLFSLLQKDPKRNFNNKGEWINTDTNKPVTNPYKLPNLSQPEQSINLKYTTTAVDSCNYSSTLSFKVFKNNNAGVGGDRFVCYDAPSFNIFDLLTDSPSKNGKWTLPNGVASSNNDLILDPKTAVKGNYIYKTDNITGTNGAIICQGEKVTIKLSILKPYAGEDTTGLEFCEDEAIKGINLTDIIKKDSSKKFTTNGTWINTDTNQTVSLPFTVNNLSEDTTFNFKYTVSDKSCNDEAIVSFKVYKKLSAGSDASKSFCSDDSSKVNLFDLLGGKPSNKGFWILPNGNKVNNYNLTIQPNTAIAGVYKYEIPPIANAKNRVICVGTSSKVTITIQEKPNAGDNVETNLCINNGKIDLLTLLSNQNDDSGQFFDSNNKLLTSSILDLSQLSSKKIIFTYKINDNAICKGDQTTITINPYEPSPPTSENQSFCAAEKFPLVSDLKATGGDNYQWYGTLEATTPLTEDTIILDGEDYFVATTDNTGCSSKRTKIVVSYIPVGSKNCKPCISDGVSDNNDGINDGLELCNLPNLFPNFTLEIYNRLGILVYKGDKTTDKFNGKANVPNYVGGNGLLPTGVYFYVFYPNDDKTKPIQSDFYLGR